MQFSSLLAEKCTLGPDSPAKWLKTVLLEHEHGVRVRASGGYTRARGAGGATGPFTKGT